ncbi:MAG TPA: beta-ketoacyl-ACP synthase [Bauldia sp.]|nr:beta-ketoacyl-ACP synthase [Bauldia sp.]
MAREAWITGIGVVSSLGEGPDVHWAAMAEAEHPSPNVDMEFTPPFGIHPMVPLELDKQIPKKSDQRQMEPWQRLGTYAAGLALSDAGIAGNLDILSHTHAVVAADGGERDVATDTAILDALPGAGNPASLLNERLTNDLRPTLFLAQLPNLVAGNISIVHKVTGSSRTFMGEEVAGASALEIALKRIGAAQGDIFLVGGACLAERKDSVLNCALGGVLWSGPHVPVWERIPKGGGAMLGSVGAFLIVEAREHAEARGARAYARLADVRTDQSRRRPGDVAAKLGRQLDALAPAGETTSVLSAATGVVPATAEERELLGQLIAAGRVDTVRATATMLGAATSATVPAAVGLAALAIARRGFYRPVDGTGFETPKADAPARIAVTSAGMWRGEASALVTAIG